MVTSSRFSSALCPKKLQHFSQINLRLNFSAQNDLYHKIQGFRRRFNFQSPSNELSISLGRSFLIRLEEFSYFCEELKDECDSFFLSRHKSEQIRFSYPEGELIKKKYMLYLLPFLSTDMEHLTQSLSQLVSSYTKSFEQGKVFEDLSQQKNFLTLGKFHSRRQWEQAMQAAIMEFNSGGNLQLQSLDLSEKKQGQWQFVDHLLEFDNCAQSNSEALAWIG